MNILEISEKIYKESNSLEDSLRKTADSLYEGNHISQKYLDVFLEAIEHKDNVLLTKILYIYRVQLLICEELYVKLVLELSPIVSTHTTMFR